MAEFRWVITDQRSQFMMVRRVRKVGNWQVGPVMTALTGMESNIPIYFNEVSSAATMEYVYWEDHLHPMERTD